jgi:FkbM family methyltransferase
MEMINNKKLFITILDTFEYILNNSHIVNIKRNNVIEKYYVTFYREPCFGYQEEWEIKIGNKGKEDCYGNLKMELLSINQQLKMTPLKEQIFSEHCINYGGRGLTEGVEGEEAVQLTTIDNLGLTKLDFIILDVQGFELHTLKGGETTIKANKPLMFIENYLDSEQDQKVINLVKEWGYEVYRLEASHNEDCIAVYPSKHLDEIKFIETQQDIKWKK